MTGFWARCAPVFEENRAPFPVQVEGTCSGVYGFVLAVISVLDMGEGLIREGTGAAVFNVTYQCVTFKPHKGEVLDVVVSTVNKVRPDCVDRVLDVVAGCIDGQLAAPQQLFALSKEQGAKASFVHASNPPSHPLTPSQMGFFAEAGPLQVFVSNHLIPEAFEFNSTHEPCYVTADGEQKIAAAADVRLRIVGTRIDANEIVRPGSEGM